MSPKALDRISTKYNLFAYGLPDKFWDWYRENEFVIRPVIYMNHAKEKHNAKFNNRFRDLVTDMMPDLQVGDGDPFECWYLPDGTLRKFHLNLPCYYASTNTWEWHDHFTYAASFCFERGKYLVGTVYPRKIGDKGIYNKSQYIKP